MTDEKGVKAVSAFRKGNFIKHLKKDPEGILLISALYIRTRISLSRPQVDPATAFIKLTFDLALFTMLSTLTPHTEDTL